MATTIRNENLFCLNCGEKEELNYPVPITEMVKRMGDFDKKHSKCKPTWKEPIVDQSKTVLEKALFWNANGEKGGSSKTMFNCFMGVSDFKVNHPLDPSDFKRCYKLLEAVPEWKSELYKLKPLSKPWSNLVDNWDKLTQMYEQNVAEEWKNYNEIGMYEFMQTLIR